MNLISAGGKVGERDGEGFADGGGDVGNGVRSGGVDNGAGVARDEAKSAEAGGVEVLVDHGNDGEGAVLDGLADDGASEAGRGVGVVGFVLGDFVVVGLGGNSGVFASSDGLVGVGVVGWVIFDDGRRGSIGGLVGRGGPKQPRQSSADKQYGEDGDQPDEVAGAPRVRVAISVR